MASVSQGAAARPFPRITGRCGLVDNYFYFSMSFVIAAIVVWGFSHTIGENLLHAAIPRPLILWFHASFFSLWVLFFIFQTTLVRTRNVKWHRFFGWFGLGLGTIMIPLGIATAIAMTRFETYTLHEAGSDHFMIVPFFDMVAFTTFFALAIVWRKKPELHRRFIYIATCGLLAAAFGRFDYIASHSLFYAGVDALICLGVIRDLLVNRRVHKIYLVALPTLIVCHIFVVQTMLSGAHWWLRIAHAIIG